MTSLLWFLPLSFFFYSSDQSPRNFCLLNCDIFVVAVFYANTSTMWKCVSNLLLLDSHTYIVVNFLFFCFVNSFPSCFHHVTRYLYFFCYCCVFCCWSWWILKVMLVVLCELFRWKLNVKSECVGMIENSMEQRLHLFLWQMWLYLNWKRWMASMARQQTKNIHTHTNTQSHGKLEKYVNSAVKKNNTKNTKK